MPGPVPLNPPGLPAPISHYANGVRVGDTIYVSGQVALDGQGRIVGPGDVVAQTRQVLDNIQAVLAAGGATLVDVVKVTVFLANVDDRPRVNEVRMAYFGAHRPASTLVEVSRLALPGLLVEIEAVAVVSPRG
jgi:2-iminobutanoate/2-iminopropanoate deaminase